MGSLMAAVADDGLSVVFSSHVVAELERMADYLVVLNDGRLQLVDPARQLEQGLGWPDGRLLGNAAYGQSGAWLNLHHIVLWVTYQPASRYHEFQFIELGWLIAASALLLAGTAVLIRRRPA
jgi:hypothetical protein